MGKINVTKNTVVKSAPETFELIKALFKANGVDTDYIHKGVTGAGSKHVGTCSDGDCHYDKDDDDTEITLEQLAFESLPAPEWATMIVKSAYGDYVWLKHNKKGLGTMVKRLNGTCESECDPDHEWYKYEAVLQKQPEQPKPQPTNYRKITQAEPWEIVKRWQEDGDLYAQHSMTVGGFAKIRHIQQLAQLISQDRIYERVSELDMFVTRASETPVLGSLSRDDVVQLFEYGLRFDDGQ